MTHVPNPKGVWSRLGEGVMRGGRAAQQGMTRGYQFFAPELRTHLGEATLLALTLAASPKTPRKPLHNDGQRLVIFIHGLAGHRGNFIPMQTFFRCLGRTRTVSIGFPDTSSLEIMADHLRETVEKLVRDNNLPPRRSVDIVAHSMGGIVARLALLTPGFGCRIHTLVTLSSPHQGTELARYAATLKIKALRPSSDLYKQLNQQVPWNRESHLPRLVCLWTPKDLILLPPTSAVIEGAEERCVPTSSHLGYLFKPEVWKEVLQILNDPPRISAMPPLSSS